MLHTAWCGCVLILLLPALLLPARGQAQDQNRAGVVVQSADGQVQTACVTFAEPEISGLVLLERANLDVIVEPMGNNAKVCSIGGTGCPFPHADCWCQCTGAGPCKYWSYWHQVNDAWQFSAAGAPVSKIQNGAVDGWSWGPGAVAEGSRPPLLTFEQICRAPEAATVTASVPAATILAATTPPASAPTTITPSSIPLTPEPERSAVPALQPSQNGGIPANYIVFGTTLILLLIASVAILWKRRQ